MAAVFWDEDACGLAMKAKRRLYRISSGLTTEARQRQDQDSQRDSSAERYRLLEDAVEQELAIAFRAQDRRLDRVGLRSHPDSSSAALTFSTAASCAASSRTMPPLPTCSLPASNWGFTSTTICRPWRASGDSGKAAPITAGRTRVAEMNETSIATKSTVDARQLRASDSGRWFFPAAAPAHPGEAESIWP